MSVLSACGGGGGGGGGGSDNPPAPSTDNTLSSTHKPTLIGRFADTPISGLHYSSAATNGTTDAQGQFQYQPGDVITFKIGDIALPPVVGRPELRLTDFGIETPLDNNIARFLLGLDADGNAGNGIEISEQAHRAATGRTLDFYLRDSSNVAFGMAADPIVAAAGGVYTQTVNRDIAADHLDLVRSRFGTVNPVIGGWLTEAAGGNRAILFLENGKYYSMESNCNGLPNYEFGSYTYADGRVQLTVIVDADGPACGLNSGSQTVVAAGNGELSFAEGTWKPVTSGSAKGVFYGSGVLGNPTDHAFNLLLLGKNRFASINTGCDGGPAVEFGAYHANTYYSSGGALLMLAEPTVEATSNNACSIETLLSSIMAVEEQVMASIDSNGVVLIDITPSVRDQLLVGGWIAKPGNGVSFTSDGRYLYTSTDSACFATQTDSGGEKGTYSWDTVNGKASVHVDIDTDRGCGYADLAGGRNSAVSNLRVDGNLLTVTNGTREDFLVRTWTWYPDSGLWTRRAGAGAPLLTIDFDNHGPAPYDSGAIGNKVSISGLDSDCSTAQSFSLERLPLLIDQGIWPNLSPGVVELDQMPSQFYVDQPGCGLSSVVGPTYKLDGDTLNIDGWGTFVREL